MGALAPPGTPGRLSCDHEADTEKADKQWPPRNSNSIPPSGSPAMNCTEGWTPASTGTTRWPTERDHAALVSAVKAGRIEALVEENL